ncbi:6-carboxytetrahydropterin synthase [Opitutus sp. ER46]|uniref:6-pyruvoyl trahydropterin synthase family protein n=1 Tax=Opitutus sp. ER46 TaxID=2161864 RepID=UPI000D31B921|nr:6-carboxytetrahydropterin synthase [Opitutus sp. ER46]PTX95728.1 6-pyruvoyl tetrahydropterin synthase [Opitutus sp. ER46]
MPFRIAKTFTIESGHLLSKHPGACRFPHGHSRTVEVIVTADTLDAQDMVCDFKALKTAVGDIITRYDHAFALNTADPHFRELRTAYGERVLAFTNTDPTTEVLAREIFLEINAQMKAAANDAEFPIPACVRLERVRVTETESSWAEYWE